MSDGGAWAAKVTETLNPKPLNLKLLTLQPASLGITRFSALNLQIVLVLRRVINGNIRDNSSSTFNLRF